MRGETIQVGSDLKAERFVWGRVMKVHRVGPYDIVEFIPVMNGIWSEKLQFHPYVNGDDTGCFYASLDGALAGAIAHRHEGQGHRADWYFLRSIGADKETVPA